MILTLSTTHEPATDLGFLLHKNPSRLHAAELGFGRATVVYPEATSERCTAALVLDVDPVGLVRGANGDGGVLAQYVNDRPYSANSFMVTAIRELFGTAMNGRCRERQELADTEIPLEVRLPSLRAKGGIRFVRGVFEPLGYEVEVLAIPLDETFPEWGESLYVDLTLRATKRLSEVLTHLYVLIPVLDNSKHYWIDQDEVQKLLKRGEGWLAGHPLKEAIVRRYLHHRRLTNLALEQLVADEGEPETEELNSESEAEAPSPEKERRITLHDQRLEAARDVLVASGAQRVLDLGCGEGRLVRLLLKEKQFTEIVGMDVSHVALQRAQERLERVPPRQAEKVRLLHGSLLYRDSRLTGYDAAAVVEVVEHMDPPRLAAFERVLFEFARPRTVVLTTPNQEYNVRYEGLSGFRHTDHRFEWTREEFATWCARIGQRFGYSVRIDPVGPVDGEVGAPSQMVTFRLGAGA